MAVDSHPTQPTPRIMFVPLTAHARLRLFRDSRLIATALMLAVFPAMAVGSHESWAVTAALVMFTAFPVVIALDVRRIALLDRAVKLSLLCMFAVLAGAVFKGMAGTAAALVFAVAVLESMLVTSARMRRRISLAGSAGSLILKQVLSSHRSSRRVPCLQQRWLC
jgi:hypothetical protein